MTEVAIHKLIEIEDVLSDEDFSKLLAEIGQENVNCPIFVLFTGEKINGRSWCPDCTRSEPIILATLEEYSPDAILIVISVKREPYRTQTFPYRLNPIIQLKCVPTLHRFRDGISVRSLDDNECQEANLVKTLVCES
jgi:thiol-disulfide isomerase/thioredoxin